MYTNKSLVDICKKRGFVISQKHTLSRCIGDGILQQIYYGEKNRIHIGITSMYALLPDIFWESKFPFTFYRPQNLHGLPEPRLGHDLERHAYIEMMLNGGLDVLDQISTQQALLTFAKRVGEIENRPSCLRHEWLWGAYIMCGMYQELMSAVCYNYTDRSEGFRKTKATQELLATGQFSEYVTKRIQFEEEMAVLCDLWHAFLLKDISRLDRYAKANLEKNMREVRERNIPIL